MKKSREREILLEYENTRNKNLRIQEENIRLVYEKIPEIKNIDNAIRKIGLKITRGAIDGLSEKEIDDLENNLDTLIEEKNLLLSSNSMQNDILDLKYDCEYCKDTGFLDSGEKCKCLKQKILNESYKMSNIDKVLDENNFDNFKFNIFSGSLVEGYEKSPRENIKEIFLEASSFINHFDKNREDRKDNLLFTGETGLGKTYMSSCIAREIISAGYTVIYQTAFTLMDVIEKYKFKTESFSILDEENYNNLFTSDLLIIDDLGTELINSFTISELFNIINSRINSKKKIIISTNLDIGKIGEFYTDRVLSRILGNFKIYEFYGTDLRF